MRDSIAPFLSFFNGPFARLNTEPDVANFAVGNPQEMPMPAYVEALRGTSSRGQGLVRLQDVASRSRSASSPRR